MSDKKKKKNEVTEDTEKDFPKTEEATPETEEKGEEKAETENKKESDELAKAKDQFVRLAADFDNYKKRTEAEKAALEESLSSGSLGVDELTAQSQRIVELIGLIDEKTMRWLLLSER